jgi:hypothetical protein
MRLTDVRRRVEHVGVGRGDVHVTADDLVGRTGSDDLPQGREPGELVVVVLGVRDATVRHVEGVDPDAATGRRDRPGLRVRKPGGAGDAGHDLLQPDPRQ